MAGTVGRSAYCISAESPYAAPMGKAAVGMVGPRIASTRWGAGGIEGGFEIAADQRPDGNC